MRKALVLVIGSLFFYSLFRDMSPMRTLILAAAIAASYGISRLPSRLLAGSKYPMIGLSLVFCPVLIVYPWIRTLFATAAVVMFVSFHGMALFLVTMDEKGKKVYKEVLGLAVLYGVSCANLFLAHHPELILPLSLSALVFLFVVNKVKIMPYMAGCGAVALILLVAAGIPLMGSGVDLSSMERYVLLATAFLLLLFAFAAFVKRPDFVTILAFFGLLYISLDLLLSVGFRVRGVLLAQPVLALFIVGPAIGLAMKGGKERR